MPPVNIDFANALELGSLPVNTTQSDINDAGVNYTVYYKFTAPTGAEVIWAWLTSDNLGGGYQPVPTPYDQTQTEIISGNSDPAAVNANNPIQFPVVAGQLYYIRAFKNVNTAGPEHIDIQVKVAPNNPITQEAIIINGDVEGQPCGIFSSITNYGVIKWKRNVAFGEGGCISDDNKILFDDRGATPQIRLYDGNLTELGTLTNLAYSWIRFNRTTGFFWVLINENVGNSKLYKVNPDILPLTKTLIATISPNSGHRGISTNSNETIAYYTNNSLGTAIKRWDLLTDSAMSDFATAPVGFTYITDTLCLENNRVVAAWTDLADIGNAKIVVYNSDGTQVSTVQFESWEGGYGDVRLGYSPDSPDAFWVKLRERTASVPTGNSLFKKIRASDAVVLRTTKHMEYSDRNFIGPMAVSYSGETGTWTSCPLVIYQLSAPGLYILVTNKRNDVGEAIPTPIFKTALIP